MHTQKKIFISYSVKDNEKVAKIKRDITAMNHVVWIYPMAIDPGVDIILKEEEGIANSVVVLIMNSRNSQASIAVEHEIHLASEQEARSGRKKLYIVNIDPNLNVRESTIQTCDLSNPDTYTREFCKLMRQIESHRNFTLRHTRKPDKDAQDWFEVSVWLEGANPKMIREVDYHLHQKIAANEHTDVSGYKKIKPFHLVFYTTSPEKVFAVVYLKDGSQEVLEIDV